MKDGIGKGIIWLSILAYLFWAVAMRLYYVDIDRGNSLIPSVMAASLFAIFIIVRNYKFKQCCGKEFSILSRSIEVLYCIITFCAPRIPLLKSLNILVLDVLSIVLIVAMKHIIFSIPFIKNKS